MAKKHGSFGISMSQTKWTKSRSSSSTFNPSLIQQSYDVIHVHNVHGWYLNLPAIAYLSTKMPVYWTLHDMWALCGQSAHTDSDTITNGLFETSNPNLYPSYFFNNAFINRLIKRKIYQSSNFKIITSNRWLKEKALKTVLKPKIRAIIPNFISSEFFQKRDDFINRRFRVLIVGDNINNNEYKGYSDFKILSGMKYSYDVEFVAIGAPFSQVDERVSIKQRMSVQDLASFMRKSDILVLASTHETEPLVVLEALASGMSVVAFNVGGIKDIARELSLVYVTCDRSVESLYAELDSAIGSRCSEVVQSLAHSNLKIIKQRYNVTAHMNSLRKLYSDDMAL